METKLTPQEQIRVLENINWVVIEYFYQGLCFGIKESLRDALNIDTSRFVIQEYIPLFTFKNGKKFTSYPSALYEGYWFNTDKRGYQERKAFVNWMIKKNKKLIKPSLFKRIINKLK